MGPPGECCRPPAIRSKLMRILVVEDDPDFRLLLTDGLKDSGMESEATADGESALRRLEEAGPGHFDLVLLDVSLPGSSGWELLEELRDKGREIPVIFVTGREGLDDRVRGLRMGADDYLVKPIELEELVARIEAVLRRRRELSNLVIGELCIDQARRRVSRAGESISLSPREYDLLLTLARAQGQVVERSTLLNEVWGGEPSTGSNVLDVNIGRLRRKVDSNGSNLIQTVTGQGYRLRVGGPE